MFCFLTFSLIALLSILVPFFTLLFYSLHSPSQTLLLLLSSLLCRPVLSLFPQSIFTLQRAAGYSCLFVFHSLSNLCSVPLFPFLPSSSSPCSMHFSFPRSLFCPPASVTPRLEYPFSFSSVIFLSSLFLGLPSHWHHRTDLSNSLPYSSCLVNFLLFTLLFAFCVSVTEPFPLQHFFLFLCPVPSL